MKILFTGGGTGGHIMPIIAIVRELRKLYPKKDLKLHYIGPKDGSVLLSKENFKIHKITSGKIRRYFAKSSLNENIDNFFYNVDDILFKIPIGFLQSFFLLLFIRPKLVFSKGGTGSLPITYCSKLLRIPVFLHESDVVPGKSNKITSKWAKKIFISFPPAAASLQAMRAGEKTEYFDLAKTILVGNPTRFAGEAGQVRKELLEKDNSVPKEISGLTLEKPVILIMGGSQGSETINNFVITILNELLKKYELIHITGPKNYEKVKIESLLVLNKYFEKYNHLYLAVNRGRFISWVHSFCCSNPNIPS